MLFRVQGLGSKLPERGIWGIISGSVIEAMKGDAKTSNMCFPQTWIATATTQVPIT